MINDNKRVEFIDAQPLPKEQKKQGGIRDIINGNVLSKENGYRYEKLVRDGQNMQLEVRNLRAESITVASQLMYISKQSQVARLVKEKDLGLEESVVPPKKIKAKLNN